MMQYLITQHLMEPFLTNYFSPENNFVDGMIVYDLYRFIYTNNGKDWFAITEDHL